MALYSYEAVDKRGAVSTGQINEDSEQAAIKKLRELGYMVTDVKEVKPSGISRFIKFEKAVKLGDLSLLSRQLASMLDAGIPLTRALFTLSEQVANPTLKNAVSDVASNVEAGMSFRDALASYPNIFSKLYVSMVEAGETGGTLEESLNRLANQLDKDKALRDNIRSATFYPVMVALFAVLILVVMMVFIVPIFMDMFPPDMTLPLPTLIIVGLSNSVRFYWYLWVLGVAAIVVGLKYFLSTARGEYMWSKFKFTMPIFGPLIQKAVIARFSRTLATLLGGGIPILQALDNSGKTSGNVMVEEAAINAADRIQEGMSIARPLRESGIFPPMVIQMISVGEETGSLSELLNRIAEFYEEEVATMTKGLTALIEPIMLVVVGTIVGIMVIALYLPIFLAITEI